jgi:hypothetical protein
MMAYRVIEKVTVPAKGSWRPGTPEDAWYEVSYGEEDWERGPMKVYKVRMAYTSGTKTWSPSYPTQEDWEAVKKAMNELMAAHL